MRVDRDQAMETKLHTFSAFASDLGMQPGYFPDEIETNIGNGEPFIRIRLDSIGGAYKQRLGCAFLTIFND